MMLEWNCSRLVSTVASVAVPTAPPRLRSMFDRPEAAPASFGAMPAVVMALIGVRTSACPTARTTLGRKNWSGGVERERDVHEAARGEDADSDEADMAGIEALHQQRNERDQ